jgi:hypothetical protein
VSATLRPSATGWRSGHDLQQHAPGDARRAVCGAPIREPRYDRPDWPRCIECVDLVGIQVPAPAAPEPPISESEQRALWGDR